MQTHESLGRDVLRLIVWYPVRGMLRLLPAASGFALLQRMGDLHYQSAPGKRRQLADNLRRMGIPPERHEQAARAYLRNHYVDQLFPLIAPKLTAANIGSFLSVSGLSRLDAALRNKKGVVLVHGHFGPAHLPLAGLALMGYPMKQIGNPSDKGLSWIGRNVAFRLRMRYERRMPAEIIRADAFLRPVFAALKQNQVVMITGDGSGTEEEFGRQEDCLLLGQPVRLPLGPAILARKTGAALLPLFLLPGQETPFAACIGEEISSPLPGLEGAAACARSFAAQLEQRILQEPGWMHFLDRFQPGQFVLEKNERRAAQSAD
ncbi:MAG: LpxL/LpxP family acyltransferase [Candidatus Electronema sp. VV]